MTQPEQITSITPYQPRRHFHPRTTLYVLEKIEISRQGKRKCPPPSSYGPTVFLVNQRYDSVPQASEAASTAIAHSRNLPFCGADCLILRLPLPP